MSPRTSPVATTHAAMMDQPSQVRVTAHLQEWSRTIGLRAAVLSSVDGFAQAQSGTETAHGERLAAMTSAMLGLAGAVGRELKLGVMEVLILEAGQGKVLMLHLPARPAPLLLMAACDRDRLTGNVLWSAKECGQKILAELGGT